MGIDPSLVDPDWLHMRKDGKPYTDLKALYSSLDMNYNMENLTLTSVTGYLKMDYGQSNDYSFTSRGALNVALGENFRSWSQELRLTSSFEGPLNFTFGGYYEDVKRNYDVASMLFYVGPDPATGNVRTFSVANDAKGKTLSGFGQLRWDITEKIELAGGVRYTKEKRTQFTRNTYTHPIAGGIVNLVDYQDPNNGLHGNFEDSNWSPEATLSYKVAPDVMVYTAYKTGYKSGGFSTPALYQYDPATGSAERPGGTLPLTADKLSFGPETSKGFEVGVKGLVFGRKLRFELTAYRYDYKALQLTAFDPTAFAFFIANAGAARIQGVELQTEFKATPELSLFANVAYNKARFTSFPTGQCYTGQPSGCVNGATDLSGTPLTRAPAWTLSGGFSYDTDIGNNLRIGINGDVDWKDDYITQEDHNPMALQHAYARFNAGARVYSADDKYELAVIGRNLANKNYFELSSSKAFGNPAGFGDFQAASPRRREIRIQATMRFFGGA